MVCNDYLMFYFYIHITWFSGIGFFNQINIFFICLQCFSLVCKTVDYLSTDIMDDFYDSLSTQHIKSIDAIIATIVLDQTSLQKLKGQYSKLSNSFSNRPPSLLVHIAQLTIPHEFFLNFKE